MNAFLRGTFACLALCSISSGAFAQDLQKNQTEGFGANEKLIFNYTQSFDCVDQPGSNLDFDKRKAQADPDEQQTPICQAGIDPTINPPGRKGTASTTTAPLYVLVPMFSSDNDQNPGDAISCHDTVPGTICGRALGVTLIKLFGALPEAFKATPAVYAQCPEPDARPGTCTMHASRIDLAPVLGALGLTANPPTANIFVPTPNHSHVLEDRDVKLPPIWWQVLPVLVLDKNDWPPQDGSSGITSAAKMNAAIDAGRAIKAPSNFFLFFGSKVVKNDMGGMDMSKMH